MLIKKFTSKPFETNCYVVASGTNTEAIVIDPDISAEKEKRKILGTLEKLNLDLVYIVNTHYHTDHIRGNAWIKKTTGAREHRRISRAWRENHDWLGKAEKSIRPREQSQT